MGILSRQASMVPTSDLTTSLINSSQIQIKDEEITKSKYEPVLKRKNYTNLLKPIDSTKKRQKSETVGTDPNDQEKIPNTNYNTIAEDYNSQASPKLSSLNNTGLKRNYS